MHRCEICNKDFAGPGTLKIHYRVHNNKDTKTVSEKFTEPSDQHEISNKNVENDLSENNQLDGNNKTTNKDNKIQCSQVTKKDTKTVSEKSTKPSDQHQISSKNVENDLSENNHSDGNTKTTNKGKVLTSPH